MRLTDDSPSLYDHRICDKYSTKCSKKKKQFFQYLPNIYVCVNRHRCMYMRVYVCIYLDVN